MINQRQNELIIIGELEKYLGCPVILANQHSPAPAYPYASFTVTTPIQANNGMYGNDFNGHYFKPIKQTWSFTIQSDDDAQSNELAIKAHNWFALVGINYLSDAEIYVERVENISNRDNLITIQYEYRKGFDVVLVVNDEIDFEFETIQDVKLSCKTIVKDDVIISGNNDVTIVSESNHRISNITLFADRWIGTNNLYSQVVTVKGVTKYSQIDITPSAEQLAIFYEKDIAFVTENKDGVVTVYAIGQKPTNDYTIQVTIIEVSL